MDTLIANNGIAFLGHVFKEYTKLYDTLKGVQVATVTTAIALDEDPKAKVSEKVEQLTSKDAKIVSVVDESNLRGSF